MTFLRLLILAAIFAASGCAWGHKSSSRIVEGNSPTIKYTNRESAGGRIGGR